MSLGYESKNYESKKKIDYFLALNGINMPLAIVGTEAVWYDASKAIELFYQGCIGFLSACQKRHQFKSSLRLWGSNM